MLQRRSRNYRKQALLRREPATKFIHTADICAGSHVVRFWTSGKYCSALVRVLPRVIAGAV